MKYIKFIRTPDINMYPGIIVDKNTKLEYENDNVKQSLKDLVFHSVTHIKGKDYTSTYDTTINLKEGDILIFEEKDRGYIKPAESMQTIEEAISDLNNIKEV